MTVKAGFLFISLGTVKVGKLVSGQSLVSVVSYKWERGCISWEKLHFCSNLKPGGKAQISDGHCFGDLALFLGGVKTGGKQ